MRLLNLYTRYYGTVEGNYEKAILYGELLYDLYIQEGRVKNANILITNHLCHYYIQLSKNKEARQWLEKVIRTENFISNEEEASFWSRVSYIYSLLSDTEKSVGM